MAKNITKFSVLMSVYEKEKPEYFDAALKSVLNQTLMPNEVVICEDGKIPDSLKNVIKKYKNKYPKIVRSISYPKNRGLGLTLRDGVLECKNEIIFRMDTDDISVNDRFEKQLKVLIEKDVDVLGSNIDEYDEQMTVCTGKRVVPNTDSDIKNYLRKRNPFNHQTVVFKRQNVLDAGNYKDMTGFEDYYLWARMANNGCKFSNINECLVKVRGGIISRRGGRKYLKYILNFERAMLENKIIDKPTYLLNISSRMIVCCMPNSIRKITYQKALRKKNNSIADEKGDSISSSIRSGRK